MSDIVNAPVDGEEAAVTGQAVVQVSAPVLAVAPQVEPAALVQRLEAIREAQRLAMVEGVDYGKVPGTDKDALFKPGAEKLSVLFQLDVQLHNEKQWSDDGHLTVVSHATVFHAPTGHRLGYGEGVCSTREKKYGKRRADRECPSCGAAAIKRSKYPPRNEPNAKPGWYCFDRIGGCGENFTAGDEKITGQTVGDVTNPDLADMWNTVDKMASKRARVDAVLAVTGASALFTQDVEDQQAGEPEAARREQEVPPNGLAAADATVARLRRALAYLFDEENVGAAAVTPVVERTVARLARDLGGYVPHASAMGLLIAAAELKTALNPNASSAPENRQPVAEPAPEWARGKVVDLPAQDGQQRITTQPYESARTQEASR